MKKIIVFLLLIPSLSFAADWTQKDTGRELAFLSLLVLDYGQTVNIARHPEKFVEHNPILGKHPAVHDVHAYMLGWAVLHPFISYLLPPKYREWWQYGTIMVEIGAVGNNLSAGIGVRF